MTCPYCKRSIGRKKATVDHMNKYHQDELEAAGMDACQVLYFNQHGTLHGRCCCGCGKETEWNYKTGKPYRLSSDPACRKRMHEIYEANLMNARGIDQHTLMSDTLHQKDMMRHRKISGVYQFKTDGGKVEYMGQLEKKWLMFCDVVMDMPSCMFLDPPESIPYYDEKEKVWREYIPDYYLPDYNLMVEIKDGGDHPNGNMEFQRTTKYKVQYKDKAMKAQTKYNYIRIGGSNYGPFLETLYKIVHDQDDDDTKNKRNAIIVISESACIPYDERMDTIVNMDAPEDINVDNVRLMIGYLGYTGIPRFVALTDSKYFATWYVGRRVKGEGVLKEFHASDPLFQGAYRLFKYIGDPDAMKRVFNWIASKLNGGEPYTNYMWYIPDILNANGINLDDGADICNNNQHKSDFIEVEAYYPDKKDEIKSIIDDATDQVDDIIEDFNKEMEGADEDEHGSPQYNGTPDLSCDGSDGDKD